jgi:hypothetical protein
MVQVGGTMQEPDLQKREKAQVGLALIAQPARRRCEPDHQKQSVINDIRRCGIERFLMNGISGLPTKPLANHLETNLSAAGGICKKSRLGNPASHIRRSQGPTINRSLNQHHQSRSTTAGTFCVQFLKTLGPTVPNRELDDRKPNEVDARWFASGLKIRCSNR